MHPRASGGREAHTAEHPGAVRTRRRTVRSADRAGRRLRRRVPRHVRRAQRSATRRGTARRRLHGRHQDHDRCAGGRRAGHARRRAAAGRGHARGPAQDPRRHAGKHSGSGGAGSLSPRAESASFALDDAQLRRCRARHCRHAGALRRGSARTPPPRAGPVQGLRSLGSLRSSRRLGTDRTVSRRHRADSVAADHGAENARRRHGTPRRGPAPVGSAAQRRAPRPGPSLRRRHRTSLPSAGMDGAVAAGNRQGLAHRRAAARDRRGARHRAQREGQVSDRSARRVDAGGSAGSRHRRRLLPQRRRTHAGSPAQAQPLHPRTRQAAAFGRDWNRLWDWTQTRFRPVLERLLADAGVRQPFGQLPRRYPLEA